MSNNINSTQISALLRLYPMAIPGAETNVLPAGTYHLGIPLSIHSPSTDLYMVIDPVTLLSTSFAVGDSVRLWVNGQATSVIKIIKKGEENDRIEMELSWGSLMDGLNTLYYEVTRVSSNKEKSDPILNVLFNNPASGITVSHPPSVGPGQPATFTLTRSYPREYDRVELTVGTWSITIPYVHPANPIIYTLTSTDLQQIGDGNHPVSARAVDQLSNNTVSPTSFIKIDANREPLAIDNSLMVLDAVKFSQDFSWAEKEVQGNVEIRQAKGGIGPYTYIADDPLVVSLTPQGKVAGLRNGTTNVRVFDQAGATALYQVRVRNVFKIIRGTQRYQGAVEGVAAQQWIRAQGGLPDDVFLSIVNFETLTANFSDLFHGIFESRYSSDVGGMCLSSYGNPITWGNWHIGMSPNGNYYWTGGFFDQLVVRALAFVPT